MKHLICLLLFVACAGLYAESMQINTPGGNIGLTVTDNSTYKDGKTTSGTVIDNIALKLQEIDETYLTKLTKMDQVRTKKLMEEIYALLALLPTNDQVAITTVANTSNSASTSAASSNMNVNINVSGNMQTIDEPADTHGGNHHNDMQGEPVVTHHDNHLGEKPEHQAMKAMSESDFNMLMNKVKAESFSEDQLRVIRTATKNANYNVAQIVRMIDTMTYSDDKIEALRIMYPKVVDPKNNYQILDAMTYSADKEKAEEIINN
jgi:hypothetical protein